MAAWNLGFPTQIESTIWKVACFVVTLNPPLLSLLTRKAYNTPREALSLSQVWALVPFTIFFISARAFLISESFISLRHVPIGVYATVPWV